MEYVRIQKTELMASRIGIGGDPMGLHAWGDTKAEEMINAVQEAIDQGINYFDTADIYGLGTAEELLGKGVHGHRNHVIIASKFGVRRTQDNTRTYFDNSPIWIRKAIEGSLRRLKTDYIDIYQIHNFDGVTPLETIVNELEKLKLEGKIRYFGLSNITQKDFAVIEPFSDRFCTFQDEFSLACRAHEKDIMDASSAMKMTPITWGSLGQGILTGKYGRNTVMDPSDKRSRPTYPNFHGEKLQKNIDIVEKMQSLWPTYHKKPAAIAIRFILDYIPDSIVLVGVKHKKQVVSNCHACGWNLTKEHMDLLDAASK